VVNRVDADDLEDGKVERKLKGSHGVLVPGGFGTRGILGKLYAAQYAREHNLPFFGICLGMQVATIEFARNVCGLKNANSTEFDQDTRYPVICLLEEQKHVKELGATMRLGAYSCRILKDSKSFQAYKKENIIERHRHRYEFNNEFRKMFEKKGIVIAGYHPQKSLVEIVEFKHHPWFVGCQFHPEFRSKPDRAHPLFHHFIQAALNFKG